MFNDRKNNNNNTPNTTPAKGTVVLIDGHQYRDRAGRIHTLTLIKEPASLMRLWLLLAQLSLMEGFDLPKEEPKLFETNLKDDRGRQWFADFRGGLVANALAEVEEAKQYELVEDVTEGVSVNKGPRKVKLGDLKNGDKFESGSGSGRIFTRDTSVDLPEDLMDVMTRGPKAIAGSIVGPGGQKLWGMKEEEVFLVEESKLPMAPNVYPLRLPITEGRRYVTRSGKLVTNVHKDPGYSEEIWGDVEGERGEDRERGFNPATG